MSYNDLLSEEPPKAINRVFYSVVLWVLVIAFGFVVAWAYYFKIDQTAKGVGTVITSSRIQIIQAVDGGVLELLNVKEGDRVEKDQVLAVFDQTKFEASVKELEARLAALRAHEARLRAEVTGAEAIDFPEQVKKYQELVIVEKSLFKQRKDGFESEQDIYKTAVKLATKEVQLVSKLARTGDVSQTEILKAERLLNEAKRNLVRHKNEYYKELQTQLAKTEDETAQNVQILAQRAQLLANSVLRAPVSGIVKNVRITTLGGVLRTGEELMQIVPVGDKLIVEAKIAPADIADIALGLSASLRFDAFDYSIFGAVEGRVIYISADTLREETSRGEQTFYRVHLETTHNPVVTLTGKKLTLLPGMTAQVDVRTGERTVMDVLLKPIKKTMYESFSEK
ncbi:MAG: HlyD family efflux transporter periplasmic adaptor subunit [Desulfotalea sp.]